MPLRLEGRVGTNRSVNFSQNNNESMTFSLHWLLTASLAATGLPITRQLGVRTCTIDEFQSHSSKPNFEPIKVLQKAALHVIMVLNLGNIVTSHFTKCVSTIVYSN